MISIRIHGYMDFMMGLLLLVLPIFGNFPGSANTLLVILGAGTIMYSLITNYETSLLNILPMKTHLMIDLMAGMLLIVSPWLFGFADEIIWPFLVLGAIEIGASLMTSKHPSYERTPEHH